MTTTLIRLPGSKWWVEVDDESSEIVATYNKAAITDEIQAINAILSKYPDPNQQASDFADVLVALEGKWTANKNARIVAMLRKMWQLWQAYGDISDVFEIARLNLKRDELIVLRGRLV